MPQKLGIGVVLQTLRDHRFQVRLQYLAKLSTTIGGGVVQCLSTNSDLYKAREGKLQVKEVSCKQ